MISTTHIFTCFAEISMKIMVGGDLELENIRNKEESYGSIMKIRKNGHGRK